MSALDRSARTALICGLVSVLPGCPGKSAEAVIVEVVEEADRVAQVRVFPDNVATDVGTPVTFQLLAFNEEGVEVSLAGATVQWSTDAGPESAATGAVWAFAPVAEGTFVVTGTLTGSGTGTAVISAESEGLSDATTVVVTQPPPAPQPDPPTPLPDAILGETRSDGHAAAYVVQGRADGGIVDHRDRAYAANGSVDLGVDLGPRDEAGAEISEAVGFASNRSAVAFGIPPADAAWQWKSVDQIPADPFPALGDPIPPYDMGRTVPLYFGLPPTALVPDAADLAAKSFDKAQEIFNSTRSGIRLGPVQFFEHALTDAAGNPSVAEAAEPCYASKIDPAIVGIDAADPPGIEDDVIFVVLFMLTIDSEDNYRGYACNDAFIPEDWRGRMVMVSTSNFSPTTLAHEIVHVLGHDLPGLFEQHVDTPPFTEANLMSNSSGVAIADLRDHLTLGQLYRMNFDMDSWLNSGILALLGPARDCQSSDGKGECPELLTDLPGGS